MTQVVLRLVFLTRDDFFGATSCEQLLYRVFASPRFREHVRDLRMAMAMNTPPQPASWRRSWRDPRGTSRMPAGRRPADEGDGAAGDEMLQRGRRRDPGSPSRPAWGRRDGNLD